MSGKQALAGFLITLGPNRLRDDQWDGTMFPQGQGPMHLRAGSEVGGRRPASSPALQQRGCGVSLGKCSSLPGPHCSRQYQEGLGRWRGGNELERPLPTLSSVSLEDMFWSQSCRIPNGCWWTCLLLAPGPSSARPSWFTVLTWQ